MGLAASSMCYDRGGQRDAGLMGLAASSMCYDWGGQGGCWFDGVGS